MTIWAPAVQLPINRSSPFIVYVEALCRRLVSLNLTSWKIPPHARLRNESIGGKGGMPGGHLPATYTESNANE